MEVASASAATAVSAATAASTLALATPSVLLFTDGSVRNKLAGAAVMQKTA
jgi:hypothetical protein